MNKASLRNIRTVALRTLIIMLSTLAFIALVLYLTIAMIAKGPSKSASQLFVTTILETGQLKFLASWYFSEEEITKLVDGNSMAPMEKDVDVSLIKVAVNSSKGPASDGSVPVFSDTGVTSGPSPDTNPSGESEEGIEIKEVSGRTFFGTLMIIHDPSRVSVATTYPWGAYGKNLDALVTENNAIAGVNGGLYNSYGNSGSAPFGVAVSNGEIQLNDPASYTGLYMIGFNNDNILVIKSLAGMRASDFSTYVEENGIRDAVAFQEESSDKNNHFVQLIINGEARELNGMGSGLNPRTAIGQRADGAVLLLVTDGRGASGHLGASASDLINIMMEYGAVNAANLDGGSSSCMYYKDDYLMTSVTFYYSNSSWKLPTAFIVK